jgi:hypothetical protein
VALGGKQEGGEILPIHGKAERVSIRDSIDTRFGKFCKAKNNQKISLPVFQKALAGFMHPTLADVSYQGS